MAAEGSPVCLGPDRRLVRKGDGVAPERHTVALHILRLDPDARRPAVEVGQPGRDDLDARGELQLEPQLDGSGRVLVADAEVQRLQAVLRQEEALALHDVGREVPL